MWWITVTSDRSNVKSGGNDGDNGIFLQSYKCGKCNASSCNEILLIYVCMYMYEYRQVKLHLLG